MGQLPMFVLLVQGNNLAQVPSLSSNHFTAFIFPDICLYISVPHKGAIISPCTLWRSNTKTGDTPPTQGSKLNTVLLCFSTQQVLSGSLVSPLLHPWQCTTSCSAKPRSCKGWRPFGHVRWDIPGRLRVKMFLETGRRTSWLFKSPLWSLDAVAT